MLFIETQNLTERQKLQEEFKTQAGFYIVPANQRMQISNMLNDIVDQIEGNDNTGKLKTDILSVKIMKLCQDLMNSRLSLTTFRQIFEIIQKSNKKISAYEEYVFNLNQKIMEDIEDQQNMSDNQKDNKQKEQKQFIDLIFSKESGQKTEVFYENNLIDKKDDSFFPFRESIGLECAYEQQKQDTSTMHTLKSEFETPQNEFKKNNLKFISSCNSIISEIPDDSQQMCPKTSKNQFKFQKFSFYSPSSKKQSIERILMGPLSKSSFPSNDSDYFELSGHVHPIPSFLYNSNIGEMIVKQKTQDLKKSNLFENSTKTKQDSLPLQKNINQDLKKIKLNIKRKGNKRKQNIYEAS